MDLPAAQPASAVLFADNYGLAGAVNELGRGTGLPTAVSSQNSEWWRGTGNPHATTIVAVAPGPAGGGTGYGAYLGQFFTNVRVAATLSNPYGLHNQQWGGHVYIAPAPACRGPRYGSSYATTTDSRRPRSRNRPCERLPARRTAVTLPG
jgi:hypothetical protein